MRHVYLLLGLGLICPAITGCAMQVTEQALIRPVRAGTISIDALAEQAPAYTLTEHSITASDGTKLHAVLLTQEGAQGTILYFGGNGYTIGNFGAYTARVFAPLSVNLMIVDHRGYGMSDGVPNSDNLESDGLDAFDYLAALPGVDPRRIVVHGQSLGSFIAGYVAAHRATAAVVLESSITTTEQWAAGMAKGIRITVAEPLKGKGNLRNLPLIDEPLLLIAGREDKATPPHFSQALFDASPLPAERKAIAIINGAGHNDSLTKPEAITAYGRFLLGVANGI